ncbi:MAG: hypothetical protein ABR979_00795 [Halobacteriota archaeon]|jgi:hypothetical protein
MKSRSRRKKRYKAVTLNFARTNSYGVDASELSIPAQNNVIFNNATTKANLNERI